MRALAETVHTQAFRSQPRVTDGQALLSTLCQPLRRQSSVPAVTVAKLLLKSIAWNKKMTLAMSILRRCDE